MKVRMTDTIATPTISYQRGRIYDIDDAEARRLIDASQATDDLSEQGAAYVRTRQTMDKPASQPVEGVAPKAMRGKPGPTTLPSQTAASVEAQATAEVDKHGVSTEEPVGSDANKRQHPGEKTAGILTTDSGKPATPAVDATKDATVVPDADAAARKAESDAKRGKK